MSGRDGSQASNEGSRIVLKGNGIPSSIYSSDVSIHQSEKSKLGEVSSPKVRTSTITGQTWQPSAYYGNMIASNNDFLAYVLESRSGYVVRLIQLKTKDRTLLKKFTGKICDLSFAHANSNVLGIVDQAGNLHVYDLDDAHGDVSKMGDCLKLRVLSGTSIPDDNQHRLVWCPFVSQPTQEETEENLIVGVSHGSQAEVYDVKEISSSYSLGLVEKLKLKSGFACVKQAHDGAIFDLALSPDGNVLATGGQDGHVKFWGLNLEEGNTPPPRCLHNYQPHEGSPVTRLIFCDNHLTQDPNTQFWRFLLTASEDSTVVKVWCTVKWKCLQTLRFLPPLSGSFGPSKMSLSLDISASYLLITDTTSMVLYVLPLYQEHKIGDASFSSISEYLLNQQILSFVISGHTPVPLFPLESSDEDEDEQEGKAGTGVGPERFNPMRNAVVIKVHCIQTKSLQELHVRFEPPGITGIPHPATEEEVEDTDSHPEKKPLTETDPLQETYPSSAHEPADGYDPLKKSIEDLPGLEDINTPYAPGQMSPSVKLMPPGLFTSPSTPSSVSGNPSTFTTPTFPLRSPSDFESLPTVVPQQTETHTEPGNESQGSLGGNSQIVTVPLRRLTSSDDEYNEEMVLTNVNGTVPTGANGQLGPFPSAHDSNNNVFIKVKETLDKVGEDDEDEWPLLDGSSEEQLQQQQRETETVEEASVEANLQDRNEEDDGATPGETVMVDENEAGGGGQERLHIEDDDNAAKTASIVVNTAISAAVDIVERSKEEEAEREVEKERKTEEKEQEEEEEEEEEVKMKEFVTGYQEEDQEVTLMDDSDTIKLDFSSAKPDSHTVVTQTIPPYFTSVKVDDKFLEPLTELVRQQQLEIHALRNDTQKAIEGLQSSMQQSLNDLSRGHSSDLAQQLQDHYQRLEKLFKDKQNSDSKKLTQTLAQTVNSAVNGQLEKSVKNEMRKTVTPAVQRQMASIQEQTSQLVQQKLATIDVMVRESIERAINAQGLVESVSNNIAGTLHHLVQRNTEAVFVSAVLPAFEKAMKDMFQQINEAFKRGLAEYLSQMQQQQSGIQETSLQTLTSSLIAPNSPLIHSIVSTLSQELTSFNQQLEQSLTSSLCSVIKSEIEESIVSGAANPSIKQQKDRIQTLLQEKQYDMAFNLALSTSNLELVTQTCQMVGADDVFDSNAECPLSQPVLLSMIQQLAVGLHDDIELKIKYLEMAILSLDPDDRITSPHLPPVMQLLHEQILKVEMQLHSSREGTPGLIRATKRVRMLAESIRKSTVGKTK